MPLKERIAELRKLKKVSQTELGENLGFARSTVCQWEKGAREPDTETLQKLADFFNVSVDYLLDREEKNLADNSENNGGLNVPDKYKSVLMALNGGDVDLTQEDITDIVRFIEFTQSKKSN